MNLLTKDITDRLLNNGQENAGRIARGENTLDFYPVVKLFTPDGGCTWLLTEIDPENPDMAFGLCDVGLGCPEIGWVSLIEIGAIRGRLGLAVERDLSFRGGRPVSVYTKEAAKNGHIKAWRGRPLEPE
jgi:hypothetical protein